MSKQQAQEEAIRIALAKLAEVDLALRISQLGLPPFAGEQMPLRVFGKDMVLDRELQLSSAGDGKPAKAGDHILLLHYLLCEFSLDPAGELISFRDLPSGQFYWGPFQSRSIKPLLGRIGNDLGLLRKNLDRFDWEELAMGDFAARIRAFGKIRATLVYHLGDEEFSPAAELLFDSCIKRVYEAEDAAVLAGRICIGLL